MAVAKTYTNYLAERQIAMDETIAKLKLAPGSKEDALFKEYITATDHFIALRFQGDMKSRHLAQQQAFGFNSFFYNKVHAMEASPNPDDRASAATAQDAIYTFGGKMRGPSIIDRYIIEPFYDQKKKEWKPENLIALAGGLGIGAFAASQFGFFSGGSGFFGFLKGIAIASGIALVIGAVAPPALHWLTDKITGKKPPPSPDVSQEVAAQTQGQSQQQSQAANAPAQNAGQSTDPTNQNVANLPPEAQKAATDAVRSSVTILGGGGDGRQQNVGADRSQPVQYGANYYSSSAVPPAYSYNGNTFGGSYNYGTSPTGIPPQYNSYGFGNQNSRSFPNVGNGRHGGNARHGASALPASGYYGSDTNGYIGNNFNYYANTGNRFGLGFDALPASGFAGARNAFPNTGTGSVMFNPYGGLLQGSFGGAPAHVGISGYDQRNERSRDIGGHAIIDSAIMPGYSGAPLSGFDSNAYNPLAIQTPQTPPQHHNPRGRHHNPRGY